MDIDVESRILAKLVTVLEWQTVLVLSSLRETMHCGSVSWNMCCLEVDLLLCGKL